MYKFCLLFIIFVSNLLYAQNNKIPNISFQNETNNFIEKFAYLNLKDENCLILISTYSNSWWDKIHSKVTVYKNDGKILKFEIFTPYYTNEKIQVNTIKVKRKNFKFYWNFLNKCMEENKFEIEIDKLNITSMKTDDSVIESIVSDGLLQKFEIYSRKGNSKFETYAASHYIGFPGYRERQKLVDLMKDFEALFNKY